MSEIPENIEAILRDEGVSAQCWKRLRNVWSEPPKPLPTLEPSKITPFPEVIPKTVIIAARKKLIVAMKMLERSYKEQERPVHVVEVHLMPRDCVTLKDAEKAMIVAAVKDARFGSDILAAALRLDCGKTTLYRKMNEYGLHPYLLLKRRKL